MPRLHAWVSTAGICGFGCTCAAFRIRWLARGLSTFRTSGGGVSDCVASCSPLSGDAAVAAGPSTLHAARSIGGLEREPEERTPRRCLVPRVPPAFVGSPTLATASRAVTGDASAKPPASRARRGVNVTCCAVRSGSGRAVGAHEAGNQRLAAAVILWSGAERYGRLGMRTATFVVLEREIEIPHGCDPNFRAKQRRGWAQPIRPYDFTVSSEPRRTT